MNYVLYVRREVAGIVTHPISGNPGAPRGPGNDGVEAHQNPRP